MTEKDSITPPQPSPEEPAQVQPGAEPAGNVTPLAKGAAKRRSRGEGEGQPEASGAPASVTPIAAAAQKKQASEKAAEKKPDKGDSSGGRSGGKREKTPDWGKYNFLLANFALIYGTDTVWDGSTRLIMKIANMAHAHGSDVVKMWKMAPERRTVMLTDVVFDPTEQCDLERCVNLFGGIKMEPKAGDVTPMLELMRYMVSRAREHDDECDEILHWLICWIAYPMQRVGAKLRTAVIMHGDEGAGKNFIFDVVTEIYGEYGKLVGQDELEDKFNDWRSRTLFVVGDEVSSRQELVHNKNRLKALITSPVVQINPKNLPRREEANHINVAFLSNELQPLALDNTDRRYLVLYTPRPKDFGFYKRLGEWRSSGGVAAFYHYLLNYDTSGFDPYAPAPATLAKLDLIDLNRKSPERFWLAWSAGELDLPYQTCSLGQAYQAYLRYATRVGDRFPIPRPAFTRMVLRISESEGRPAKEKVMKLGTLGGAKKCERMFLVTDPPADVREGEWATESEQSFRKALNKYLYGDRALSPDGEPPHGEEQ